tara:strand:+ start:151 stop:540 length:390 start_codon:yes stop_codon:yes gene_type:complete
MDSKVMAEESRKMSPESVDAVNDILSDNQQIQYKTEKGDGLGNIKFSPGLPNEEIIEALLNNKIVIRSHPDVVQKVLNMEWQWFERRIVKWLGDTPEARNLEQSLRDHIKNEKKWIKRGAKADEVGLFK